ncbi:hypothetical protein M6D81_09365 [Paenibacillus sp. J5C_2022]|uniref:phosphotriesterase family protein n=1 Tax=Paenibacillus sp. J5C2022 TaxID=2977129 RepID=UPI0021D2111F|nr:hypothetical protein [Paenibacillus sp. J5C2022]MCU6708927.1 hypothetical protein [Paenibacillus sp. J5C2022]
MTTVTGKVEKGNLGWTLPHEHIYIDLRGLVPAPCSLASSMLAQENVTLATVGQLRRNPYAVLDNAILDEKEVARAELLAFKQAGGQTIVDLTLRHIGRDPVALADLSRELGIHIIAGCGYYIHATHPPDMNDKTIDQIADELRQEICVGIDGTNIRAGVIGEIGTSEMIYPNERKSLIAAAIVQQETGLGIHVHTDLWSANGLEIVRILTEHGASPNKICINHMDVDIRMDYLKALLHEGVYVEFDNFGKEYYADKSHNSVLRGMFARDIERVRAISELMDDGFLSQILVSNDVCLKTCLHRYGGWGYDHLLTNIIPMMEEEGILARHIRTLMRDNPANFLDCASE